MIEECVPFSYIDRIIDRLEKELEYELYEDDDRDETQKLSHQIEMLKTLKRMWLEVNR